MKYDFSSEAIKTIEKMDANTIGRLVKSILNLPKGDVKPMKGFSDGRLRLRVGKYRIVFAYVPEKDENQSIHIIDVDTRGDIYK